MVCKQTKWILKFYNIAEFVYCRRKIIDLTFLFEPVLFNRTRVNVFFAYVLRIRKKCTCLNNSQTHYCENFFTDLTRTNMLVLWMCTKLLMHHCKGISVHFIMQLIVFALCWHLYHFPFFYIQIFTLFDISLSNLQSLINENNSVKLLWKYQLSTF